MPTLRIATRKSPLALWQTEHVAARLRDAHPGLAVELVPMSTRGDQVLDRSLADLGGKGLFLKELELAMQRGEADCAVHSLKDVPMELEPGFALAAILARADHADAFVCNDYPDLDALPRGARVGTSSLRRQAQLRALRPDLHLLDLRGSLRLIPLEDVHYLQAEEKYVIVHHARGEDLIEESLKSLEDEFGGRFVRIHRNCLVARHEIVELRRAPDGHTQAVLRHGKQPLEVSRRCVAALRETLKHL